MIFEIYFHDLTEEAQEALLTELGTTGDEENFDICPLAIIEREDD